MRLERTVTYPKKKWSRGCAWDNLHNQQIPGCPKRPLDPENLEGTWTHGWVKNHGKDEWSWVYWSIDPDPLMYPDFYRSDL